MRGAFPANKVDDAARARLFDRFHDLNIAAPTVPYPAHRTVEEGKALRGTMAGTFTKNLLVKDKKARHFLLSFHEDRALALKILHRRIGGRGQVGFASAERVQEYLGVQPGALTPLGLINDATHAVTPVIDARLMDTDQLNFHPLINTESTGLHPKELLSFILSCGHEPMIVDFDAPLPE
ncbi:prolyl-tRNA synthetase associated domain-containing protein [Paracoccus versutus]|uniref:Ala-tRNA(Pro) hydrolase n=1 Tax=Paracoccus versutus TaxID=34007 RepID=A0A3D9XQC3_PARVE|nr:prolyl-tRNA synthetase associated domain-containing protein [Paracoccus versutus]REF72605.1 Ala-tRNA(Pro) hydrolase [Paracoccus versutus]WGR55449.1 prolyl-tRNA synthetase associated domain-containing protein [Paracoccus versutus]